MIVHPTRLSGVLLVEPRVFEDDRGFFLERYHQARYAEAGIREQFVQDNHSRSERGVLRGLHFQKRHPQGKLVEVVRGRIQDVVVDLRASSPTFGEWESFELGADPVRQLWVPPGFAHGFATLSDSADVLYKCTDVYRPDDEGGVVWDDPDLGIEWQVTSPRLSAKDLALPRLHELAPASLPSAPYVDG